MLKLQSEHEVSARQLHAARELAQANAALKKEAADLRFRIVMSGSDAANVPADTREEWRQLKDDLTAQAQQAEARAQALQAQFDAVKREDGPSSPRTPAQSEAQTHDAAAQKAALARTEAALAASQERIAQLEAERARGLAAMAQVGAQQAGANVTSGAACFIPLLCAQFRPHDACSTRFYNHSAQAIARKRSRFSRLCSL